MESAPPPPATESPSLPCWSAVIRKTSASAAEEPIPSRIFGNCNSNKGISVAVVDANAIIHGDKLVGSADSFVSVREVLDEVRDPVSRQRLAFLPFHVDIMEPSPESIKKGESFRVFVWLLLWTNRICFIYVWNWKIIFLLDMIFDLLLWFWNISFSL